MTVRLGQFLLKGLKKKRRPARSLKSTARKKKKASSPFPSFVTGRTLKAVTRTKPRPSPPSPKTREVSVLPLPVAPPASGPALLQPQVVHEVRPKTPQPWDLSSGPAVLSTVDILKPSDDLRMSIEGFLLDQRSPHTRKAYGTDLKRFVKFLLHRQMDRGIEKLDRSVLIAYKEFLISEKLEHTTVDRHLATLRSFFQWLVDDGRIAKSPVEGVRFLNPKRLSRTQGFTNEEVQKILSLPDLHTRTGAMAYAILMVLFYCGLRRSELCGLRTSSVSKEREIPILKLRGKGNSERLIPMPPPVWKAVKHYLLITHKNLLQDQYLFTPVKNNRTGVMDKALDPSAVFYIVTKYSRMAGVANRVSPHSCRATAISNARDHHVPDRVIQEFAGWASPDMITRYDKRKTSIEKSAAHAIKYGAEDRNLPDYSEIIQENVIRRSAK